jgi:FlaG/FlaF family flagellin (archaellin)
MNQHTLLLRQVHPSFVQADKISSQVFNITSQVFKPTPKDKNKLSVYNGEKFTAEESHTHFTGNDVGTSCGVVGVTCDECSKESLVCLEDNDPFDGHAMIDFTGLTNNQIEKNAKKLKASATTRGWLYRQS